MKKIYAVLFVLLLSHTGRSQSVVLSENFDAYDGLIASVPAGFYISWNDTSASSKSYYFSSAFCGLSCNSYKFGVDSAEMITPVFSNPGSVSFYLKGNGSYQPNKFMVYESPNGSTWNLVSSIDSVPAAAQTVSLPLNASTTRLRFYFQKDILGYNAGFDDLVIYGPVGLGENPPLQNIAAFPVPASTELYVDFGTPAYNRVLIELADLPGRQVFSRSLQRITGKYTIDVGSYPDGMYLLKIKTGRETVVRRVVIGR